MTTQPGSAQPEPPDPKSTDAEIDAFFSALFGDSFGDSFAELGDASERRELVGVTRTLRQAQSHGSYDSAPPAALQSRVLAAVRAEAAPMPATGAVPRSRAEPEIQTLGSTTSLAAKVQRFRGRIVVILVALVAAITTLFSSFGSSPVIAATAILAPNPGSPTPGATGTVEFISPKKGANIDKVEMNVEGLTPTTDTTEYQCWLVGPGDSPTSPNRKLVGTFSTKDGKADFGWKATDYSPEFAQLDISLEQKDGNPEYGGVTVLSTIKYNGKRTG